MIQSRIPIPSNCFNPKSYVKSDPASGLLSSRHGDRLIAVPELLLRSIPKILRAEAGEASYLALYTFGENWGKTFSDRILKDIGKYEHKPILEAIAVEFFITIQAAWSVHGLGQPVVDFSLAHRGILIVTVINCGISGTNTVEKNATYRSFSLEAGFIAGWFSNMTGENLKACASNWEEYPASIQFLVGATPHIEDIENSVIKKGLLDPMKLDCL